LEDEETEEDSEVVETEDEDKEVDETANCGGEPCTERGFYIG
jgi:hypothetical protein